VSSDFDGSETLTRVDKEEKIKYKLKVNIVAVGAGVLLPIMCIHYPLGQSHLRGYYLVFNGFKLPLQKANYKFQRAHQAS
jgi:hypothetical protein